MVEAQVDVNHRKDHEEPHHEVMPLSDRKVAPHQGHDPGERARQPAVAHGRIHPESGDGLKHEGKKGEEVGEARQTVVSRGFDRLILSLENVHLKDISGFPQLLDLVRDEIPPAGKLIAYEAPVNPEQEVEEEHEGRYEVNETGDPEPVAEGWILSQQER